MGLFDTFRQVFSSDSNDQSNNVSQAPNQESEQNTDREMLELLRTQNQILEAQTVAQNPEYAFEKDKERYLTPENLLNKKGLPVIPDESTGISFIPKDALDYYNNSQNKPAFEDLRNNQQVLTSEIEKQRYTTETLPELAQYLNANFPELASKGPINVEKLMPHLLSTESQALINQDRQREAVELAVKSLQLRESQDRASRNAQFRQQYGDLPNLSNHVRSGVMLEGDDGDLEESSAGPFMKYAGKQVVFVVPDNAPADSPAVQNAMREATNIAHALQPYAKLNPKLGVSVRVTTPQELSETIAELKMHPEYKVFENNTDSLIQDTRFLEKSLY